MRARLHRGLQHQSPPCSSLQWWLLVWAMDIGEHHHAIDEHHWVGTEHQMSKVNQIVANLVDQMLKCATKWAAWTSGCEHIVGAIDLDALVSAPLVAPAHVVCNRDEAQHDGQCHLSDSVASCDTSSHADPRKVGEPVNTNKNINNNKYQQQTDRKPKHK